MQVIRYNARLLYGMPSFISVELLYYCNISYNPVSCHLWG